MTVTLFGIPNCDTIKKAKKWLTTNDISFEFHDYRKDGITPQMVEAFCAQLDWLNVLNKRGTTYRKLTDEQKSAINEHSVIPLLVAEPAMIKRPILLVNEQYFIGFKPEQYQTIFTH